MTQEAGRDSREQRLRTLPSPELAPIWKCVINRFTSGGNSLAACYYPEELQAVVLKSASYAKRNDSDDVTQKGPWNEMPPGT